MPARWCCWCATCPPVARPQSDVDLRSDRGVADEHHRFRVVVLGDRPRRPDHPGPTEPPPPGFLVSADDYHRDHLGPVGTRATTFSPTDTMPLTRPVKMLMFIQPLASLTTIAIVGARAVNILS